MLRIVLFLLVISVPVFAATTHKLPDYRRLVPPDGPTPELKDGWLDPTGGSARSNCALAFYAAYTKPWPSYNASFFNMIDLAYFGETAPVQVEEIEVACCNRSLYDGDCDLIILPDDGSGYPDLANHYDVQEDVADSWISGTYPYHEWNNFTYSIPVKVTADPFWIGLHTYWPSSFNFYIPMHYTPGDGGSALYDAGMVYYPDVFQTIGDLGYASGGAFGLKCYVAATDIESASLGEIKAVFK